MRLQERMGALGERQFRLLWLGQSASGLGDAMALVALAFGVLRLTGSPSDLGLVMSAWVVSRTALTLFGGVWADRLPRRLVMVGSDLVRAATQATVAAILLAGTARIWHLVALMVVYGAADAFFGPAQTGLVPATVSPGRLQQANALLGLSRNSVALVGPALSGVLVAVVGAGWVFAVDAATFVASAVCLILLRVPALRRPAGHATLLADLKAGWREVAARSWVWASILYFAVLNMATTAIFVLGPVVAVRSLGGAEAWGLLGSCATVGAIGGGLVAVRLRPSRPLLAGVAAVSMIGLEPLLLARPSPLPLIAAAAVLGFAGVSFDEAVWSTALQEHVPEASISRVSAYDWMGSFVVQPLGYVAVGPLAAAFGLGPTLVLSAALVAAASAAIALVPGVRRLRPAEPRAAEPVPGTGPELVGGTVSERP
jgi:MFS family permease